MADEGINKGSTNKTIKIDKVVLDGRKVSGLMHRCPVTGGICSHCNEIIKRKARRHQANTVLIFIAMHYSHITDTIYRWLLKDMLIKEEISFEFEENGGEKENPEKEMKMEPPEEETGITFQLNRGDKMVTVCLVRADDYAENSHVLCESICAKIQEADMVIADLSYESPNVFYELGLAVALEKKILPVCYMRQYYQKDPLGNDNHIRTFPWKERLLKFFSISRIEKKSEKIYENDAEYMSFPYTGGDNDSLKIGERLMALLNKASKGRNNLFLYDLKGSKNDDGFNIAQKVEDYDQIVKRTCQKMDCAGDRICLMYLNERLTVGDPEVKEGQVEYSFGDICRMAVNQGVHDLETDGGESAVTLQERYVGNYICNCTLKMKLDYPVLVDYVADRRYEDVDAIYEHSTNEDTGYEYSAEEDTGHDECSAEEDAYYNNGFTYYDVMLANAANSTIAFMDFRKNRIETLYWLGVFHGRGRLVIPLRYEQTNSGRVSYRQPADVAGLWNAYYFSENAEEFRNRIRSVLQSTYIKQEHLRYCQKKYFLKYVYGEAPDKNQKLLYFFEEYYKKKFWEAMFGKGDVDVFPTVIAKNYTRHISNWEYDGFSRLLDYVNDRSFGRQLCLSDSGRRSGELKEEYQFVRSYICMGDREVNAVTRQTISEMKELYRLEKADNRKVRGFLSGCKGQDGSYLKRFYSFEELDRKDIVIEEPLEVCAHLVIKKEGRQGVFGVVLEGASGPGTYGLAKLLSAGMQNPDNRSDPELSGLFLLLQKKLLHDYMEELKEKLDKIKKNCKEEGYAEAYQNELENGNEKFLLYMKTVICSWFLPMLTSADIEVIKKRGRVFANNMIIDSDAAELQKLKEGKLEEAEKAGYSDYIDFCRKKYKEVLQEWGELLQAHKYVEAIVTFGLDFQGERGMDSRKLRSVRIEEASIRP